MGYRISLVILMIAVLLILIHQTPVWWNKAGLIYWQHRCVSYVPVPHRPVLREGAQEPTYTMLSSPWQHFSTILIGTAPNSSATLFTGERVSPAGHHRLVFVNVSRFDGGIDRVPNPAPDGICPNATDAIADVFTLGSLGVDPVERTPANQTTLRLWLSQGDMLEESPLDSVDRSHIAFDLIRGSTVTLVNGWLRDDDTVAWEQQEVGGYRCDDF